MAGGENCPGPTTRWSSFEEGLEQIRADEPGAAGDQPGYGGVALSWDWSLTELIIGNYQLTPFHTFPADIFKPGHGVAGVHDAMGPRSEFPDSSPRRWGGRDQNHVKGRDRFSGSILTDLTPAQ